MTNNLNHSFRVDIAKKVGVNAAIIHRTINYYILKNIKNGTGQHDGLTWTSCSIALLVFTHPYLTTDQVRSAIKKLEENHYLVSRKSKTRDRTLSYALPGTKAKA